MSDTKRNRERENEQIDILDANCPDVKRQRKGRKSFQADEIAWDDLRDEVSRYR